MPKCILGTYHKSGSTWMAALCSSFGNFERVDAERFSLPSNFIFGVEAALKSAFFKLEKTDSRKNYLINRTGHCTHRIQELSPYPIVRMMRDPRDMVISAYYSHLYSHKDKPNMTIHDGWNMQNVADRLQTLSISDGLLFEMDVMDCVFQDMAKWDEAYPLCETIRFENMLESPEPLVDAFRFLGLIPGFLSETDVVDTYNNCSFKNLSGRAGGTEDRSSQYRNGLAGDWKNHFSSKHKNEMKERFGPHLKKLGYEADDNW